MLDKLKYDDNGIITYLWDGIAKKTIMEVLLENE